ncbi:unnamed protein product [Miscanthus lutarioriparius]|uniref:non-specific serine/threonine protein kinase n=1 Tax=Miscanthus lutarioriparius TaxID=422564 RepID=A0A811PKR0_9POAL|nr:unnamed protein product [Miscanthus lutarioriparius]
MDIDLDRARALRVLGRGAMGTVFLVAEAGPSASRPSRYALKVFDKRSGSSKPDADRRARWEINVLSRLAHPHLPSLLGFTETDDLLAWAVPYCSGGDLNELRYSLPDRVFSPAAIRFYIAEIVSAVAELHAAGVVYRDLKPENVLLRADGHVTLTDFDLSRLLNPRPSRTPTPTPSPSSAVVRGGVAAAAAPEPGPVHHGQRRRRSRGGQQEEQVGAGVAREPEARELRRLRLGRVGRRRRVGQVLLLRGHGGVRGAGDGARRGHCFAVDWWAVGVLVYEMAFGRTPFKGRTARRRSGTCCRRSSSSRATAATDTELADLISGLLERDPRRRLGYAGGADEIRAHPFFAGVAWDMLMEVCRPPYIPPPADEDLADGAEGFDVRGHFKDLHQPPPTKSASESSSSDFSTEF